MYSVDKCYYGRDGCETFIILLSRPRRLGIIGHMWFNKIMICNCIVGSEIDAEVLLNAGRSSLNMETLDMPNSEAIATINMLHGFETRMLKCSAFLARQCGLRSRCMLARVSDFSHVLTRVCPTLQD